MVDKREAILVRLLELGGSIKGIRKAFRNKDEVSEGERPAFVIFDADETAEENDPGSRPVEAPRRVIMNPEMYLILGKSPATVGTDLNELRAAFLKSVFTDAALKALTLDRAGIRYEGSATGLSRGRKIEGTLGISISFTYLLIPTDL